MDIKQVIQINKLIHKGNYDSAKQICQKHINEYLEYNDDYGFNKFNLDLNMGGFVNIGDDMLKQYKKEYELEGYKSQFEFSFNLSKYSDTTGYTSWDTSTKDQIFLYLVMEIKPDEVTSFPFDLSIIDNYYSVKDGAYELIVKDKERCTIKVDFEKM